VSSLEILSYSLVSRLFSPKFGPRVALGLHAHAVPKIKISFFLYRMT
jgi:hypothetical protein